MKIVFKALNAVAVNKNANISQIIRTIDSVSTGHCFGLIKYMEQNGLVVTKKQGRERFVQISDKGKELYDIYKDLRNYLPQDMF